MKSIISRAHSWLVVCILVAMLVFMGTGCAARYITQQDRHVAYQRPYLELIDGKNGIPLTQYCHLSSKLATGDRLGADGALGQPEDEPGKLSDRFDKEIRKARKLYSKGNYVRACLTLQDIYPQDPDNKFLISIYAQSLYQLDHGMGRAKSYDLYRKLVNMLDQDNDKREMIRIDLWFMEAYWKLATLYMDCGMWDDAIYEMSRTILAGMCLQNRPLYEQLMGYMTEAYFGKGDYQLAEYYARKTKLEFPANEYVNSFLNEIEEKSSMRVTTLEYDRKIAGLERGQ